MLKEQTPINLGRCVLRNEYSERPTQIKVSEKIILGHYYFRQNIPGTHAQMFLREEANKALVEASKVLPEDYSFYIFDAYRSLTTQIYMFNSFKKNIARLNPDLDEQALIEETLRYVPHPDLSEGAMPHNTGGAIDLGICHKGRLIDFGSGFDEPCPAARTDYFEKVRTQSENIFRDRRRYLVKLMQDHGFCAHPLEWWHFDLGNEAWANICGEKAHFFSMNLYQEKKPTL